MDGATIAAYAFGIIVILLVLKALYFPLKIVLHLAYHVIIGAVILWSLNIIGQFFGLHFALNPASALAVGYLGIPGVGLLYALQRMMQ